MIVAATPSSLSRPNRSLYHSAFSRLSVFLGIKFSGKSAPVCPGLTVEGPYEAMISGWSSKASEAAELKGNVAVCRD